MSRKTSLITLWCSDFSFTRWLLYYSIAAASSFDNLIRKLNHFLLLKLRIIVCSFVHLIFVDVETNTISYCSYVKSVFIHIATVSSLHEVDTSVLLPNSIGTFVQSNVKNMISGNDRLNIL